MLVTTPTPGNLRDHPLRNRAGFLLQVAKGVLQGLDYLDAHQIVHTNLDPGNIHCVNNSGGGEENRIEAVKLSDYGLGHMTNYGLHVSFPVFVNPRTTPPEVFSHTTDLPQDRSGQ